MTMLSETASVRPFRVVGGLFAISFVVGMIFLGDLAGAFADRDAAFEAHFSSGANRAGDLIGSVLLIVAAATFLLFVSFLTEAADGSEPIPSIVIRSLGGLVGGGLVLASACFATVPASIGVGDLTGDPGLQFGQAVLPQLGYVALVASMLLASAMIVTVSRFQVGPRWLAWSGYGLAVLLTLGSGAVSPVVLLAVWVALVSISRSRSGAARV
jgi:hypothetical protein